MVNRDLLVHVRGDQACTVPDYECIEPGQKHAIRDGWRSSILLYGNQPVHCVRCGRQLYLTKGTGWYCMRISYRIDEEP